MHFSDKNFDDLQYLLSYTNFFFDIIAVGEAKITKQEFLLNILNLRILVQGGTLVYNANHPCYKCLNDLHIYKNNEVISTFIETVNPRNQL